MVHEVELEKASITGWTIGSIIGEDKTTITMPKILPCLRCGSDKVKVKACEWDDSKTMRCECENGHAWDEWLDTEDQAIVAWNERPIWVMTSAKLNIKNEFSEIDKHFDSITVDELVAKLKECGLR